MEVRRQILPFPRLWHSRAGKLAAVGLKGAWGAPHAAEKRIADHLGLLLRK